MSFKLVSLAVILFCSVAAEDINITRKEAIKKIDKEVESVTQARTEVDNILKWKPQRTEKVYSVISKQQINIMKHNMVELEEETLSNKVKAEIKNCKNAVFGCIANAANDGEVKIKEEFKYYAYLIALDNTNIMKNQKTFVGEWDRKVKLAEENYKKSYNSAVFDVYDAKSESQINEITKRFATESSTLKGLILGIDPAVDKLQLDFMEKMQNVTYGLRSALITTKNKVFDEIKKCFTIKIENRMLDVKRRDFLLL